MHSAAAVGSTTFLLVRHAQTIWNQEQRHTGASEVALAPVAERQIAALTRTLLRQPIHAIYSSPLSRCRLTVQHLADILELPVGVCGELKERSLGTWEGMSPRELLPTHPGYHFPESAYNGDFRIPGAEPLEELEGRIRTFLHGACGSHAGQTVLVSTHSGVIWTLRNRIVGNPPKHDDWPGNCSITTVIAEGRHLTLTGIVPGI